MRPLPLLAMVLPSALYADQTLVDTPSCPHPAELQVFRADRVGVTIFLKNGTPQALAALRSKYNLHVTAAAMRSGGLRGIDVSPLTQAEIAAIRCDPDVELVELWAGP